MSDKRRKRPMMTATASHYDNPSQDFHAVNIDEAGTGTGTAAAAPRRRSASAGRSESWMTKVTTAMSHRLFAGRRLSASRSTQVMPMLSSTNDTNKDDNLSEGGSYDRAHPSRDRVQTLRQVASEATLPRGEAASFGRETTRCTPPECLTVVCNIEANTTPMEMKKTAVVTSVNTIHVRTPRSSYGNAIQEKVHPRNGTSDWEDEVNPTPVDTGFSTKRLPHSRGRDEEPAVTTTASVLKDFFSHSANSTHRERTQQRESRRGQHYKNSKERHDRVREDCELAEQNQAEQLQREKIERLRKWNRHRRLQMRHEVSILKKGIDISRLREQSRFDAEREKWEDDFATEMETLGKAYHKASTHEGSIDRPMTVAGLAVPEALRQIQRDVVNNTRRIKTAAPAGWATSFDGFLRTETTDFEIVPIGNVNENDNVFQDDGKSSRTPVALTIEMLVAERVEMVKRIAQLERALEAATQSAVVHAPDTIGIEDGFFI